MIYDMDFLKARVLVNEETGCWEWSRQRTSQGYPVFYVGPFGQQTPVRAHRWVLGHLRGAPLRWDDELHEEACHTCDVTYCVNPAHLYVGSRADNVRDQVERGRMKNRYSYTDECPNGHKYTPDNDLTTDSKKKRKCRECWNAWMREYRARKKKEASHV